MDFKAVEQELREQSEQYRERHLSVKLSLYAGFFAFEGLALAAAAILSNRSGVIAVFVIGMSLCSTCILFLHHYWFLRLYDVLGYTKISIQSERDLDAHWLHNEQAFEEFRRRKHLRRSLDTLLFILPCAQMLLLAFAAW